MKKALAIIFVVLVVLCAGGTYVLKGFVAALQNAAKVGSDSATVDRGDIVVQVVETGTVDAVKAVEVKSEATGRLAKLFVDEGDTVKAGELIAIIDPRQTQLQVDQSNAQLRGARSAVNQKEILIAQRRISAKAAYDQAVESLRQLRQQAEAQPALTKSDIAQAQSSLVSAKKELERLKDTVHPNEVTAAETAKRQADANYINAESDFQRQVELEKKGYVPKRSVENAQTAIDLAKANQDSANLNLSRIETQHRLEIGKQEDEIARLQAVLDQSLANRIQDSVKRSQYKAAIAAVAQARIALRDVEAMEQDRQQSLATVRQLSSVLGESQRELGETQIRAPIDGVVTQKPVHEGELITNISGFSAGTTIVRIEVRDKMRVTLDINEIDVAKLKLGMPAEIDVDALPDRKLKGHVSKIAPASTTTGTASTGTSSTTEPVVKYSVEVLLDDKEPRLKSGMSAKCTMDTLNKKNVLRLPVEFVGKDGAKRFVMIAPNPKDPKSKATRTEVTTGAATGAFVEILTGVKEGQRVVKPDYKGPSRKGAMQFGPDRSDDDSDQGAKK